MPLICTDGRKMAVDLRLVESDADPNPDTKIPVAAREIARIYKATEGIKGTQLVCLDFSTPTASARRARRLEPITPTSN